MKELSIEEKAKRYDEAIKRIENIKTGKCEITFIFTEDLFEHIFPELKESEDERIKKSLLEYLHTLPNHYTHNGVCAPEWIAWLEKKPSLLTKEKALKNSPFVEQKPADKKGTNLVEEEMTPFQKEVFCIIDTAIEEEQGLKQVCDKLFALASNEIKQKFSWSEEDDIYIENIILAVEKQYPIAAKNIVPWLKSLKDRYTWKPSDLQLDCLSDAIKLYNSGGYDVPTLKGLLNELRKLKE